MVDQPSLETRTATYSLTRSTTQPLKILHIFDHSLPIHSGYAFRSIAILREQRERGWDTSHLTTPKHTRAGASPETVDEFTFHRTPPLRGPFARIPFAGELTLIRAVAREIGRIARAERPDILHAHSPVLNVLACLMVRRRLQLPVVYEMRGLWEDAAVSHGTTRDGGLRYRASRALEGWALTKSDAITAICDGLRHEIIGRGVVADRITLIPNGVDLSEFSSGVTPSPSFRASLGIDRQIVLGFLGSFYEYEGLIDLLSALRLALIERKDLVLLLAGGGPVEDALRNAARSLGVAGAVRFLGRIPHSSIRKYYDVIDIFVYPRRSMRLTEIVTPLKPLEAMASGGIVLASDVGGHRELLRHGETGFLYPAGDVEALAQAILRLAATRDHWPAVARAARHFVERERSWAVTTAGYGGAYASALQTARLRGIGQGSTSSAGTARYAALIDALSAHQSDAGGIDR